MAWIELHETVFGHRKTRKMSRLLGIPCVPLAGHLAAIWCWALNQPTEGQFTTANIPDIEDAAEWSGEAGAFVAAMVEAGYFDADGDYLELHDWQQYAGKFIEKKQVERAQNTERQRKWRMNHPKNNADITDSNDRVTPRNGGVTRNAPTNQPTNQEILPDSVSGGVGELSLIPPGEDSRQKKDDLRLLIKAAFDEWYKVEYGHQVGRAKAEPLYYYWYAKVGRAGISDATQCYLGECAQLTRSLKDPATFLSKKDKWVIEYMDKTRNGSAYPDDNLRGAIPEYNPEDDL